MSSIQANKSKTPNKNDIIAVKEKPTAPTEKMRDFAESYCNESKGVAASAWIASTNFGPSKLKMKSDHPKRFRDMCSKEGMNFLRDPRTLKAIEDVKARKSMTFWLSEEEILSGLYSEATNVEVKSSQAARIQAWVWLGKHIGMFQAEDKTMRGVNKVQEENASKAPIYNIVQYNTVTTPDPSQIEKGISSVDIKEEDKNLDPSLISITSYNDSSEVK